MDSLNTLQRILNSIDTSLDSGGPQLYAVLMGFRGALYPARALPRVLRPAVERAGPARVRWGSWCAWRSSPSPSPSGPGFSVASGIWA